MASQLIVALLATFAWCAISACIGEFALDDGMDVCLKLSDEIDMPHLAMLLSAVVMILVLPYIIFNAAIDFFRRYAR